MEFIVVVLAVIGIITIAYFAWYAVKARAVMKNVNSGTDDQRDFKMMIFVLLNQMQISPVELGDSFMYKFNDGSYISISPSKTSDNTSIIANGTMAEEIAQCHLGLMFQENNYGKIWNIYVEYT